MPPPGSRQFKVSLEVIHGSGIDNTHPSHGSGGKQRELSGRSNTWLRAFMVKQDSTDLRLFLAQKTFDAPFDTQGRLNINRAQEFDLRMDLVKIRHRNNWMADQLMTSSIRVDKIPPCTILFHPHRSARTLTSETTISPFVANCICRPIGLSLPQPKAGPIRAEVIKPAKTRFFSISQSPSSELSFTPIFWLSEFSSIFNDLIHVLTKHLKGRRHYGSRII
jgi:hypothetical protein